ncbi:MAG TPA: hypothetical protein VGL65_09215 [Gemmatimonadales bacterium]|jgi:hypothetical protein
MQLHRGAIGVLAALIGTVAVRGTAQSWGITPMVQAIGTVDHSDPVPGRGSLTEARLVEPMLMLLGHGFGQHLQFTASLDLEGLTMPGGELTPGDWGEGFVDRRHPHTYAHELMAAWVDPLGKFDGKGRLGLALGKGFVPFGSDDPMSRPFLRYPVNHHLSQLPERAVAIVQYAYGPVTIEGATFDGDEPTKPSDWPLIRSDGVWRFGDSHAGRLTVRPIPHLEIQGSLAHVHSPENRDGAGPDADKQSMSARWDNARTGSESYALAEWARTSELDGFFVYHTWLGEGMLARGRARVAYRFESTERPEEVRLADPFRTLRPSPDNSILGISRWTLHTIHLAYDVVSPLKKLALQPFVEATLGHVTKVGGGVFDPIALYGTDQVRALSVGLAIGWGMQGHRMGRYGVLSTGMPQMPGMSGMQM